MEIHTWNKYSRTVEWKYQHVSMTDYSMPRFSVTEIHPLFYIYKNGKQLIFEKYLTSCTWGEELYAFTVFHINLNI